MIHEKYGAVVEELEVKAAARQAVVPAGP